MSERPSSRLTVASLAAGSLVSVACLVVAFGLRLAGAADVADAVALLGVIVLIATPPVGLLTTAFEMRRVQRPTALLALLVVAVLGMATALALALR